MARTTAERRDSVELERAGDNGENGRVATAGGGVLFIRAGFLVCSTRNPRRFYPQFEARLIFGWDLWKISL
jgi:hypothetical protein